MAIYRKTGKIKPILSKNATDMRFGVGMEKLDRNVFDPNKTYKPVSELGVKRVRLQSGWMRTERKRGEYDFKWLDEIVDNLLSLGIRPWLCLCYGNPLYTERAKHVFGGVGCPPVFSDEEKKAWANYCKATAVHFKGRITEYEVWNEPDGEHCWKHGVNGKEYGEFAILTAKAVKSGDENAEVLGGSVFSRDSVKWLADAFKTDMGEYLDKLTFHDYSETETRTQETASIFRYIVNKYNPRVKLAMGETGCPSSGEGFGALNLGNWTEDKQARLLLKRMVAELRNDVDFISWFTAVDMIEALHGETGKLSTYLDYGYFGVLRAEFDENGISTGDYSKKPSFYVLQNVISLFQHAKQAFVPVLVRSRTFDEKTYGLSCEYEDLDIATFEKPNGGKAFAYWKNVNTLTSTFDGFLSLIVDMPIKSVNLVDPLTGDIMEIPSTCIKYDDGVTEITGLPVKDYPLVLTFDGFIKGE